MERMKLTEKEKDQIVKSGAEAMSKIIERMSIEMGELEEENKELKEHKENLIRADKKKTEHIDELEEENKKLKSDLAYERTMLDNVRAEYKSSQNVIKKLKAQIEKMSGIGLASAAPMVIKDGPITYTKDKDGMWHKEGELPITLC